MGYINIFLHFENVEYAKSLARGLCYESTGLNVFFADNRGDIDETMEYMIILTDKEESLDDRTILLKNDGREIHQYQISKLCSVKALFSLIKRISLERYGICLLDKEKQSKVIEVFSKKGGSGVTSFAITLARIIGIKTESRVLYLNLGIVDDYTEYLKPSHFETLSKKQFLIMSCQNTNTDIEEYFQSDIWNVFFFKPENGMNSFFLNDQMDKIIDDILNEGFFSYIIIDSGKKGAQSQSFFKKQIEMLSNAFIYRELETKDCLNFCMPCDEESFYICDGHIEISMKGTYAGTIEAFIDDSKLLY